MLALLLVATLAQPAAEAPAPGTVAVYLRPGPGLKPSLRQAVLASVTAELADAGFAPSIDARDAERRLKRARVAPCPSGIECLFPIARALGADVLVAVDATEFEGDVAVALEAAAPVGERRLARHSAVVRTQAVEARLREELEPFARELRAALAPPPQDAPLALKEPPAPAGPSPLEPVPASPGAPSRTPALIATGGAALAGGAAILFAVSGFSNAARSAEQDVFGSLHAYADASEFADRANRDFTISLASLGVTAALTTAAILLWPEETKALGLEPRADR